MRSLGFRTLAITAAVAAVAAAATGGCGSGGSGGSTSTSTSSSSSSTSTTTSSSTSTSSSTTSSSSSSGAGGGSSSSSASSSSGTGGGAPTACTTTAQGQRRGSAIALTSDGSTLVSVNRDAGSVTITSVAYPAASVNDAALTKVAELVLGSGPGSQPWQVIIDGCDETAYVVLRNDQKVVAINNIKGTPSIGASVAVGSEPTSLALTPNQTKLYVSNWVDGNLTVIDPATMTVTGTVDLNTVIANTGFLGPDVIPPSGQKARPALAHPRGIAITNNGDATDTDETVYVTEWFAVRTGPEVAQPGGPPANTAFTSDTNWEGLLYALPVGSTTATTIPLPPVLNTTFNDAKGNTTGCFPNQVASVTIENEGSGTNPLYYAYVTSTCASPAGPVGVFQFGACQINANCTAFNTTSPAFTSTCDTATGVCTGSCSATSNTQCGVGSTCNTTTGECSPVAANAKTTTHPGLTIVNLTGATPTATTTALDAPFTNAATNLSGAASTRMPLLPTDVDFRPGFAYIASEGADALFRLSVSGGKITAVGSGNPSLSFIDLHLGSPATIRLPIGVAINQGATNLTAFVANDGSRTITAVNLSAQAASANAAGEAPASSLPTSGSAAASVLNGKRFFTTGLGRWSLNGAAWGSCAACHVDGLSDNVTWYFARGPRQTTSLDGTFGKSPPAGTVDQRILNWTAINDEIADFETNVRGISGGVGAIVSANSSPPVNGDRINLISSTPPQTALEGSSAAAALDGIAAVSTNWGDITNYVAQIRSPRAVTPTLLNATNVTAGKALFQSAVCNGCHSGEKWTLSTLFYTPSNTLNDAFGANGAGSLSTISWTVMIGGNPAPPAGFPSALVPTSPTASPAVSFMRSGAPPAFEQIQCVLRPVGTIAGPTASAAFPTIPTGVSPAAVNVLELRQDMGDPLGAAGGGQGSGTQAAGKDFTVGFNIPSLLGVQVGAPFFHAGNARSLEELFTGASTADTQGLYSSSIFVKHAQALSAVSTPSQTTVPQLVAYLLSIDSSTTPLAIPSVGTSGGDLCHP